MHFCPGNQVIRTQSPPKTQNFLYRTAINYQGKSIDPAQYPFKAHLPACQTATHYQPETLDDKELLTIMTN